MILRHVPAADGACSIVGLSFENLLRLAQGWPMRLVVPGGSLLLCALPTDEELAEILPLPELQPHEENAA